MWPKGQDCAANAMCLALCTVQTRCPPLCLMRLSKPVQGDLHRWVYYHTVRNTCLDKAKTLTPQSLSRV